jgi:hypothetical protein
MRFRSNTKHVTIGLALVLSAIPMVASATVSGQKLSISTNVEKSCAFSTIPAIGLVYDWQSGFSATTSAALTVQCNAGTPYYFTRDAEPNFASDQSAVGVLAYTLLIDDSAGSFDPQTNTGSHSEVATGSRQDYSITVNAVAGQHVPSGPYTCSIAFKLNY